MIEFEYYFEIEGHMIRAMVEADGHVYKNNHGEDADGNRGELRTELDDLEITIKDGHGKDITEKMKSKHQTIYADIEEEAENLLFKEFGESNGGFD